MMRVLVLLLMTVMAMIQQGSAEEIRIGAFNIRTFGVTKASKPDIMDILAKIIRRYDVLLIQEIRDVSETAIYDLLELTNRDQTEENLFRLVLSERLGRSDTYKEQYAYFYRPNKGLKLASAHVYPDANDLFEREPYIAHFISAKTVVSEFILVGIHVDPDLVPQELDALYDVMHNVTKNFGVKDVMLLGDLNADCRYLTDWSTVKLRQDTAFVWLIGDDEDTTVTSSNCAYDRLVAMGQTDSRGISRAGVYVFNRDLDLLGEINQTTAEQVSDHYPVEVLITEHKEPPVEGAISTTINPVLVIREAEPLDLETLYTINEKNQVVDGNNNIVGVLDPTSRGYQELNQALSDVRSSRFMDSMTLGASVKPKGKSQICELTVTSIPGGQDAIKKYLGPICSHHDYSCVTASL